MTFLLGVYKICDRKAVTSWLVVKLAVAIGFLGRVGLLSQPEPRDAPDDQINDEPLRACREER